MEVEDLESVNLQSNVAGELDEVPGHPVSSPSSSQPSCQCKRHECQHTTSPNTCLEENKAESQVELIIDLAMLEILLTSMRRAE